MISYVHDDIEVVLTGRVARKELAARGGAKARFDERVEIKPKDDENGSWKKFVRMTDLYEIQVSD
jgi:hypothetical protein